MSLRRRESTNATTDSSFHQLTSRTESFSRKNSSYPIGKSVVDIQEVENVESMYGDAKRMAKRALMSNKKPSMVVIKMEINASVWITNMSYLKGRYFQMMGKGKEQMIYVMPSPPVGDGKLAPIGMVKGKPVMRASIQVLEDAKNIVALVTYFDASGSNLAVCKMVYEGTYVTMYLETVNLMMATPADVKDTLDGNATWMGYALFTAQFYEDIRFFPDREPSLDSMFMVFRE